MSSGVFVYGTLMSPEVLYRVVPHLPTQLVHIQKAKLKGYKRYKVQGQVYPAILPNNPMDQVEGLLVTVQDMDATEDMLACLDAYEGDMYERKKVVVELMHEQVEAFVYVWADSDGQGLVLNDSDWDFNAFQRDHLPTYFDP